MSDLQIKKLVEDYLNRKQSNGVLNCDSNDSYDRFKLHTVKRLLKTFDLFCLHKKYQGDFLIALREYLIVYETDISLESLAIPQDNEYGISKDSMNGKYFASYTFPKYVNQSFAEKVFPKKQNKKDNTFASDDLYTDPAIYQITGFQFFKSLDQKLAVYGALNTPDGYTTLVSLPTGGGKSLITQTLAYQKEGLTIVVVPTVSLAIDQERAAKKNLKTVNPSEEIFYYSSGVDAKPILQSIHDKKAKLLFISPEALLNNQAFENVIKESNASRYLKNIVIDEAHIVIDWGASFRVDYQCLESWRRKLMRTNPLIRTILLSATFEERSVKILKDFFSNEDRWIEIRCDSLRHEPHYMVLKAKSHKDKNQKLIELVRKMPHPMIIYVAKPDEANEIQSLLSENGINNVKTFTGLTTSSQRKKLIDEWIDDQYEIMVATSAFGVGVDKNDVRTVLHMYIPQNPNAYYQELGRGGRDRLPCLSIMLMIPDDLDTAFQRISKRVMTTEKIIGRWNSMYNNPQSLRFGILSNIDTSIKPNYYENDLLDDSPVSDADKNWNIYVLLLLRRFNLIRIHEVIAQADKYIFVIEVIDERLLSQDDKQRNLIESIREDEWSYYFESFQSMRSAIMNIGKCCWSQMFYETYDRVSEHCSGCDNHSEAEGDDFLDFPLKKPVKIPVKTIDDEQKFVFGQLSQSIVYYGDQKVGQMVDKLIDKRISAIMLANQSLISKEFVNLKSNRNVMFLKISELKDLIRKNNFYFLSGYILIEYQGTSKEIYTLLTYVLNHIAGKRDIKLIHFIKNNVYFEWIGKSFADFIDGPLILI